LATLAAEHLPYTLLQLDSPALARQATSEWCQGSPQGGWAKSATTRMIGSSFISKTQTHPSGDSRDAGPRLTRTSHSTFRLSNACALPANPRTSKASRSTTTTSRTTRGASPARTAASRSRSPATSPAGARCSNLGSRRPTPPPRASASPTGCTPARSRLPSRDTCAQV